MALKDVRKAFEWQAYRGFVERHPNIARVWGMRKSRRSRPVISAAAKRKRGRRISRLSRRRNRGRPAQRLKL
jgi:hypothetical protein